MTILTSKVLHVMFILIGKKEMKKDTILNFQLIGHQHFLVIIKKLIDPV